MNSCALRATWLSASISASASACVPSVSEDPSLAIDGQILAVSFEPAEASPKASSMVKALIANGGHDDVSFDLCLARKPLSELGPVAAECFDRKSDSAKLVHLGSGRTVDFDVPEDACRLFGPQRPAAERGQPPGRAVDPDPTGGYYQPVVAHFGDAALGSLRLDCGLAGASQAQVAEYNKSHVPNQNPALESVEVRVGTAEWQALPDAELPALRIARGADVAIRSRWSDPERYLLLSPERELTKPIEEYMATFFSSVGKFAEHRRPIENATVDAAWVAPDTRQRVTFYIVVRDGRGGTGWTSFDATVD